MLKILQISDLHILPSPEDTLMGVNTEYYFRQVLAHAYAKHAPFDLILVTGDLCQHPSLESYQRLLQILQDTGSPALCLPGNHDDFVLMDSVLNTPVVNCQPHLRLQDWQIVSLQSQKIGSQGGELAPTQLQHLRDCLAAHPDTPTLLTMHHHCQPTDSTWLDTMQISNSQALLNIIKDFPQLKIVTYGHVHQELAYYDLGIHFFAAPATCFQFLPYSASFALAVKAPGYRIFELSSHGGFETYCDYLAELPLGLSLHSQGY
jgi:Icc protein